MYNDKKICFISCINDEVQYEECLKYIDNLKIPEGYSIENVSIQEANSMAEGYNYAMNNTDAKYKVYLHQDVFIINKIFIYDILKIFTVDSKIGMIGVEGAKTIPTNGIWWKSSHKYGQVYESHTGKMELSVFNTATGNYVDSQAINGLIMITQYDIPWREDIFKGWHFYDVSQSIEFTQVGYKVVIPKQKDVWCIHDCGLINIDNGYEVYRNKFLEVYSKYIFPLVSVLIPTYNRPKYFKLALECVLNQTYKNIEIIIGDDSTNNETEKLVMGNYINKYDNIKYYHNEKNLGQFDNDLKLFDIAKGKFVNYLMDDDLFETNKIEKMMNYFVNDVNEEISLVTSHRTIIDEKGNIHKIFGNTDEIFKEDTIINGLDLGNFMLKTNFNCLGEPTTVLFRKNKLMERFGIYNSRRYGCNVDQASWFNLLSKGKAVFINEVLSYFRIHSNQQLASDKMKLLGALDYAHEVLTAREKGFLIKNEEFNIALSSSLKYCQSVNDYFKDIKIEDLEKFKELKGYCKSLKEKLDEILLISDSINIKELNELPLVSILIPAYNQTKYLKEALESAVNQTYANIEIIIGDDSTNNEVEKFIEPYLEKYKNIAYFKNKRDDMDYGLSNVQVLFKKSKGEYINYLNHDDIFHVEKIARMMNSFMKNSNITLVTSVRQTIDEDGNDLPLNGAFSKLFEKNRVIGGYELSRFVINNLINCIGEPTTVLFKKRYIEEDKYGVFNETRFFNISDVAMWFTLLQHGEAMYLSETLSYFRIHPNQNSNKPCILVKGAIDWYTLIEESFKVGIIQNINEYKTALNKWINAFIPTLNKFIENSNYVDMDLKIKLENAYKIAINKIMYRDIEYKFQCPVCGNVVERFLPYQFKEHFSDFTAKFQIIGSDTENFTCPYCYCHERIRHLVMYFNKLDIWNKYIINKRILHIAPESQLQQMISKVNVEKYICGDLYPNNDSITKIDINDIQFEDNYFDLIICNHVLEHIPNDLVAMQELYRVLKKDGCGVLQTPYSPVIEKSFEDSTINTEEKRKEFFGQADHVRVYGTDFFDRLKSVGFIIKESKNDDLFSQEESNRYGFNSKENLIMVTKD